MAEVKAIMTVVTKREMTDTFGRFYPKGTKLGIEWVGEVNSMTMLRPVHARLDNETDYGCRETVFMLTDDDLAPPSEKLIFVGAVAAFLVPYAICALVPAIAFAGIWVAGASFVAFLLAVRGKSLFSGEKSTEGAN